MGIAEALANHQPANLGQNCSTCLAINSLSIEDQDAFNGAMANKDRFTNNALTKILNDEGFKIGVSALSRHRRGECVGTRGN